MPLIPGPQFVNSPARAGRELGYDEVIAEVQVNDVSPGVLVIQCAAHNFPGTPVMVDFQASGVQTGVADFVVASLYEGSTLIAVLGTLFAATPGIVIRAPFRGSARFTPTAGAHTYKILAYRGGADGVIQAGPLGDAVASPCYVQFNEIVLA